MATVYASCNRTAATIAGKSAEMDRVALRVLERLKAFGARHEDDGTFERSMVIKKAGAGKDRVVASTDPLAIPKEYGHNVVRDGQVVGYAKGIHVFRDALESLEEVR